MHDAGLVRGSQRRGHLYCDIQCIVQIHSPTRQGCPQRYPFYELGRDEVAVSFHADLVNGQNVWMIQGRGSARLGFEPAELDLVCGQTLREKLECDFTTEAFVPRQIDLAHSAD